MGERGVTEQYRKCFEEGLLYQDFVAEALYSEGIVITNFRSRVASRHGENKTGIEIKYQAKMSQYKNLYIEYAEKPDPNCQDYVSGGILRFDNTWLWATGDYTVIYLIPLKTLRAVYEREKEVPKNVRFCTKPTSKGFLISQDYAEKLAVKIIVPRQISLVKGLMQKKSLSRMVERQV
jgi:hypothetical protein